MDTDSLCFAIKGTHLEDILKPDVRKQYFSERFRWLPFEHCDHRINDYMSCKVNGDERKIKLCCQDRLKFDKRTPGLFKLEFQGSSIVALCPTFAMTLKPKSHTNVCLGTQRDN